MSLWILRLPTLIFVQATPTIQQLGKSTLDPPQEWLPLFSHNHGSVKSGYISNRIVTFQIQGPIFRWGRKGRTPGTPPKHPTHCNTRHPQIDHKWRFQIEGDRSPTTALWSYHGGTHEQEQFLLEQFVWMGLVCLDGVRAVMFSLFSPTIVVFHQKPLKHVNSKKIYIYIYVYSFRYSLFDSRSQLRWQRLDILKSQTDRTSLPKHLEMMFSVLRWGCIWSLLTDSNSPTNRCWYWESWLIPIFKLRSICVFDRLE